MTDRIRTGNLTVIWLGLATFVGSMLFVWQGLDFTDMGFWLTGYQQLYIGPDTLGFQSVCWLTTFIGIGSVSIGRERTGLQIGFCRGCYFVSDYHLSITGIPARTQSHSGLKGENVGQNSNISIETKAFHIFTITMVLALLLQSLACVWQGTFRDSHNRFAMTHSIAHPLLIGTYTTAERAKVVPELLEALSHFVKFGDEMLAHNGIPTLYFLTQTHPWHGIAWADIEDAETITKLIRQKEQISTKWPCIVRTTGSVYASSWPSDAYKNRDVGPGLTHTPQAVEESRQVLADFERRHNYKVAWTNGFFEILTTDQ